MLSLDALRWTTVKALRGATWAEDRVFDSPAQVADMQIVGERQPFVAVFADEADSEGLDFPNLLGPTNVRLIIETGIASSFAAQPVSSDEVPTASTMLDYTDAGLESTIGFLTQQVLNGLLSTVSPWADLWRTMTSGQVRKVECVRGGPALDRKDLSQRYASRIAIVHTGVLAAPPRGAPLAEGTFWPRFIALAEADRDLAGIAELLKTHLQYPDGNALPDWHMAQRYLGLPAATAIGLNIAPLEESESNFAEPE